jgi:hypothetical protein
MRYADLEAQCYAWKVHPANHGDKGTSYDQPVSRLLGCDWDRVARRDLPGHISTAHLGPYVVGSGGHRSRLYRGEDSELAS